MPDVVLYHKAKNWLLLIEAVTSHWPVDAKRHNETFADKRRLRNGIFCPISA